MVFLTRNICMLYPKFTIFFVIICEEMEWKDFKVFKKQILYKVIRDTLINETKMISAFTQEMVNKNLKVINLFIFLFQ